MGEFPEEKTADQERGGKKQSINIERFQRGGHSNRFKDCANEDGRSRGLRATTADSGGKGEEVMGTRNCKEGNKPFSGKNRKGRVFVEGKSGG